MSTTEPENDPWLDTPEVAELFSVTPETVRNWITQGKFGECIQINGYWRIKRSAVVAFAKKNYGR